MFEQIYDIVKWIFIGLFAFSGLLILYKAFFHIYGLFPAKQFKDAKTQHKFAILIPARNESKVINGLLKSFNDGDYPKELYDIYVIVESELDPTVEICKNYENVRSFIRPNLDVKTKGAALDQVIKHIIESGIGAERGYEAYFIFDADNIVAPNFLTEMNKAYDQGYEFALGYRNSKNWNDGWVASCSALTFSTLNTFQNKCRARFTQNILVSGTGFYISARILNNLKGWPFYTLTEDVEISNFAVLNNVKATYNEFAEYYDEQPVKLKTSWNQRLRWVKGYSQVHKKYDKQMFKSALFSKENRLTKLEFSINIIPIAIPVGVVIAFMLVMLGFGFFGWATHVAPALYIGAFMNSLYAIVGVYLFFFFYAMAILLVERKHVDITFKNALITCIMNPIYVSFYLPICFQSMLKKEIAWKPIERKDNYATK